MSEYYRSAYQKRVNRYGMDYQSRIQNQRERNFDEYLYKSIYRVDFKYEGMFQPASLERYKQDLSETMGYLLTRRDLIIPSGTILTIESKNGKETPWMVWWLEQTEANGYNTYVVVKATCQLTLENGYTCYGTFQGPGATTISDTIKTSTAAPVYRENNNLYLFITTYKDYFKKDLYFELSIRDKKEGFVITGIDNLSTPGISYISFDPVPLRDKATKVNTIPGLTEENSFWLRGGQ